MSNYQIKQADKTLTSAVSGLAARLWDSHTARELEDEFAELLQNPSCAVFLAAAEGKWVGFAQCQLRRDYVEGTATSPVGYLEGIYICPEYRGVGLARTLLRHCEAWAKAQGCSEFASDCELTNETSRTFHLAAGFTEANRIICFTKKL